MKKKEKSEFIDFDCLDEHKKKLTKETNFLSEELFNNDEDKKYCEDISDNQLIKIFNGEHIEDDSAELEVSEIQENNVPTSQNKNNTLFIINDNQNIIEQEQDSILAFESKINETLNEVPYDNSLVLQQKNQIKTAFENQHYNTIPAKREVNQDILRQQERNTQIHQNTQKILEAVGDKKSKK